ncbi:hypothetical protein [Campylobacter phage CJLB-10]|nr:hypothetical protein [Campylobacter phage CJLB-10]
MNNIIKDYDIPFINLFIIFVIKSCKCSSSIVFSPRYVI